jgi:hypothetical protein
VTCGEPNERGTSDEEANLRNVTRCAIPASLLVASLLGGSAGFTLLLVGLAVLAVVALAFYGDFVDGSADDSTGALNVGLSSLALLLVLIAAFARGQAVGAGVPALTISSTVAAIVLLGAQSAVWCSGRLNRAVIVGLLRSL